MPRPMGAVRRVPMASRLVYLTMCLAACALAVSCVSLRDNPTTCESDADCAGGRCYRGFCLEGTRDAGSDGGAADARMDAFDLDAATADAPTADAPTADASVDAHAAMDVFAADTPTPLDAGADAPTCSGAGVDCTYPMPGRCAAGVTHCTPRGSVVCGRRDDPVPELCNREDDDCDGAVDENADEPCFSGAVGCTVSGSGYECVGVCQPGVLRCNDGVPGVVCEGERLPASATDGCTPDGMQASDDDCDGDIDEDCTCTADVDCYPGPLSTQGVGACRAGTAVCSSGRLGACMGAQVPMPESCPDNRTDDDCNGAVDDVPGAGRAVRHPASRASAPMARWSAARARSAALGRDRSPRNATVSTTTAMARSTRASISPSTSATAARVAGRVEPASSAATACASRPPVIRPTVARAPRAARAPRLLAAAAPAARRPPPSARAVRRTARSPGSSAARTATSAWMAPPIPRTAAPTRPTPAASSARRVSAAAAMVRVSGTPDAHCGSCGACSRQHRAVLRHRDQRHLHRGSRPEQLSGLWHALRERHDLLRDRRLREPPDGVRQLRLVRTLVRPGRALHQRRLLRHGPHLVRWRVREHEHRPRELRDVRHGLPRAPRCAWSVLGWKLHAVTRELHIDPSAHSAITAPPPPPDDPAEALVGRIVAGRYEIKRVLGRGGMGVVLLGEHLELEKRVAIKVLLASYARDAESLKRFEREARSAAKLGHTNIVGTLDLGRLETGEPFLVMEHVDGTDLVPLLGAVARGETTHERVLGLLDQIAAALDAVHGAGIVHRDVKAENILLTKGHDGRDLVKLVDFGLAALADAEKRGARLTKVGMVIGTPEYLAPECARGALGGPTADQYSLAVLAFELFWGEPPITSSNPMELLMAKVSADAPLLSSVTGRPSPLLDAALARGLERDPSRRYASCAELVAAVRRGVEELTALPLVRSKPPPARSLRSERTRRPPTATSAAPTGNETLVLPRTPQPSGEVERPPTRGGAGWIVGALLLALLIVGTGAGVALWPRGDDTPGPAPAPPPVAPHRAIARASGPRRRSTRTRGARHDTARRDPAR
jgi:serine/threonine protein kinase